MLLQAQSVLGIVALPLIAWALSEKRWALPPRRLLRIVLAGTLLQLAIAAIMLNVPASRALFDWAAGLVAALQAATNAGVRLVFGYLAGGAAPFAVTQPQNSFSIRHDNSSDVLLRPFRTFSIHFYTFTRSFTCT